MLSCRRYAAVCTEKTLFQEGGKPGRAGVRVRECSGAHGGVGALQFPRGEVRHTSSWLWPLFLSEHWLFSSMLEVKLYVEFDPPTPRFDKMIAVDFMGRKWVIYGKWALESHRVVEGLSQPFPTKGGLNCDLWIPDHLSRGAITALYVRSVLWVNVYFVIVLFTLEKPFIELLKRWNPEPENPAFFSKLCGLRQDP